MKKERLEAFSDGVLAIIITIMILGLKIPAGAKLSDLKPVLPGFLSYVLSFIYIGIYWNNHHHMMHTVKHVTGSILWANLHLLFWLSLVPFITGWVGENHFKPMPMALYGIVLFMSAVAYYILQTVIISNHGPDSMLLKAIGNDFKGKISPILYFLAIFSTLISGWIAGAIYILVAFIWLVPDKRIEIIMKNGIPH
jgi:uncharacterized membrane protein